MFEYIHVLFALLAGIIFTIIMLILGISLEKWLINVIVIMIIMLLLGYVIKIYIKKKVLDADVEFATESINLEKGVDENRDIVNLQENISEESVNFDDYED